MRGLEVCTDEWGWSSEATARKNGGIAESMEMGEWVEVDRLDGVRGTERRMVQATLG